MTKDKKSYTQKTDYVNNYCMTAEQTLTQYEYNETALCESPKFCYDFQNLV